jgi:hypothetical protein
VKTSILCPAGAHKDLSTLVSSLLPLAKKAEVLLVGSQEQLNQNMPFGPLRLLKSRRPMSEALNEAVGTASGDFLLFLAAQPSPHWLKEMEKASAETDIVVGETLSYLSGKATPYGKLALRLFRGHSKRTAMAKGHALPWGPFYNLGVHRGWFEKVGPFSPEAAGAFDIDWCWRAVLAGARIEFAPKAMAEKERANERGALLREFDGFGQGEAWLHRSFPFLDESKPDPLTAGVDAFRRLCFFSEAAKVKSLQEPLSEVAAAFGSGLRLSYERPHNPSAIERTAPAKALGWWSGKNEQTVYVPGKGLATLRGKPLEAWLAWQGGANEGELIALFRRLFKASEEEAREGLAEFISSLSPGEEGGGHHHHDHAHDHEH